MKDEVLFDHRTKVIRAYGGGWILLFDGEQAHGTEVFRTVAAAKDWWEADNRGRYENPGWEGRHIYDDPGGCSCPRCKADRGLTPGKVLVARWESRGRKHWVELFKDNHGYTYRTSNGGGNVGQVPFAQAMEYAKHQADLLGVQMVRTLPLPGQRPEWRDGNPSAASAWERVMGMTREQARRYLGGGR